MCNEIGSEFWTGCTPISQNEFTMRPKDIYDSYLYKVAETLSGRTALEHIVEIVCGQGKKKAYLPSYCCHTMIEPFLSHGMEVSFYDVICTEKGLHRMMDAIDSSEVLLLMDYFGHIDAETFEIAIQAKKAGKTVIYDATHSMYCTNVNYAPYDFIYGSYRKWLDINCGFVAWQEDLSNGEITQNDDNTEYASVRTELFDKKAMFINGENIKKESFLPLIETAEILLAEQYHHKMPDERSMDVLRSADLDFIKFMRRKNAKILTDCINELNDDRVCCLNSVLNSCDISLFIPVMVKSEMRNLLRRYLIERDIYCPVHWPLSEVHNISERAKEIYGMELSLICDQRYNREDMYRIVTTIKEFLNKN